MLVASGHLLLLALLGSTEHPPYSCTLGTTPVIPECLNSGERGCRMVPSQVHNAGTAHCLPLGCLMGDFILCVVVAVGGARICAREREAATK